MTEQKTETSERSSQDKEAERSRIVGWVLRMATALIWTAVVLAAYLTVAPYVFKDKAELPPQSLQYIKHAFDFITGIFGTLL